MLVYIPSVCSFGAFIGNPFKRLKPFIISGLLSLSSNNALPKFCKVPLKSDSWFLPPS